MTARNRTGFSLVELLVAMALSLVLTGLAAPYFPALYQQYQLSRAASQVGGDMMRLRALAVGQSSSCRMVFDEGSYQVQVYQGGGFVNDGAPIALPRGAHFPNVPEPLTFSAIGVMPNPATLTVAAGSISRSVLVNELGKVTVQ